MKKLFALLVTLLLVMIPRDHLLAQTPTATPTAAYDFPANPTIGQIVTGPAGQQFKWDGFKWVALFGGGIGGGGGGGSVIIDPTPPSNPIVGQLWFNPVDLQTYVWYTDPTSSQWVPATNVVSGGGGGGIPPPGTTIDSPIFTGTLQFPDGSYYDANGHEVMKNLGVGMVANTAGVGGVSGSSIVVAKSGWVLGNGPATADGYWDANGINQLYDVRSEYLDTGNPPTGTDGWTTVYADPENAAHNYAWGESDMYNYSAPDAESGRDQRWQAEGFQEINAIGIHQNTWQQGCTGSIINGAYLSDCAIAALPSTLNNNLNYKILLANTGTGINSQTSVDLVNDAGHNFWIKNTSSAYAAIGAAIYDTSDTATLLADGKHGLNFVTDSTIPVDALIRFWPQNTIAGYFNSGGLVLPNNTGPSLSWRSADLPSASITSAGMSNLNILAGAHYTSGNQWIADAATAQQIAMYNAPAVNIGINSGLTVGSSFLPTWVASFTPTGLNIPSPGSLFIADQNQFQSGTFTPHLVCQGGGGPSDPGAQVGQWWTNGHMLYYYIQVYWSAFSAGSGQAWVTGLPYAAAAGTGGQGGWEQNIVSTNSSSTRSSTRMIATIFQGENFVRIYDGGSYGGDYLQAADCQHIWANTASGIFITGFYTYQ